MSLPTDGTNAYFEHGLSKYAMCSSHFVAKEMLNLPKCHSSPQGFCGKAFIAFPLQLVTATALRVRD